MSAEKRSALMARIRGKNTTPELLVRSFLWSAGLRYRLHVRGMPGKPDLVLNRWDAVIFINGCFWHRHEGCAYFRLPNTRRDFWDGKLRANQLRDQANFASLRQAGWRVGVVWECALRDDPDRTCQELLAWIRGAGESACFQSSGRASVQRLPSSKG